MASTLPRPRSTLSPDEKPPRFTLSRWTSLIGAAAGASVVCAVPGAMRMADVPSLQVGFFRAEFVLAAVALVPMMAMIALLRAARRGLLSFRSDRSSAQWSMLTTWFTLLMVVAYPFGAVLRATTHHHALAGVTFSVAFILVATVLALLCWRAAVFAQRLRRSSRSTLALMCSVLLAFAFVFLATAVRRASDPSSAFGAVLIDGCAFVITALCAAHPALEDHRRLSIWGAPLGAGILVIGIALLLSSGLAGALDTNAPLFAAFVPNGLKH